MHTAAVRTMASTHGAPALPTELLDMHEKNISVIARMPYNSAATLVCERENIKYVNSLVSWSLDDCLVFLGKKFVFQKEP